MLKNERNKSVRVPIEFLVNLEYKPCLVTWLKLKLINKSSHYIDFSKKIAGIANRIGISESKLYKDVRSLKELGLITQKGKDIRLVSIWRNPLFYKSRSHTKGYYRKIKKVDILPDNLKAEIFRFKNRNQLAHQQWANKNSLRAKYGEKYSVKSHLKKAVQSEKIRLTENGFFTKCINGIQNDESISQENKLAEYDNSCKRVNIVLEAVMAFVLSKEEGLIGKENQMSLNKISEITDFKSHTTIRKYQNALKELKVLSKERDKVKFVRPSKKSKSKIVRFNPNKHFKDKFGNIFTKECNRYSIGSDTILQPIINQRVCFTLVK